ncbi:DUF58 domain-containing protein [Halarchaeum grantii]|uniref:DUF58 domain-containing protein n=1 Tax=Halarchaeum grantii TaxID=1193105 RepID=A0A830EWX7_9EURY|nr:DUF58 domain-containing protein [Halarchaeum grantii]GGL32792.1 DUF58 domain-containing protein [Halarchaeum grantii]
MSDPRRTERWTGVTALAFAAAGLAAILRSPAVLLVGALAVAVAGYADAADAPDPALTLERTLSETDPDPGEDVRVTVTVTNDGAFLPDLRVVDGVPDALDVVDGSPRAASALRSGRTLTFTYTVEATRGRHEFAPLTAYARNLPGSLERETRVATETALTCVPPLTVIDAPPLRPQTLRRVGRVTTSSPGSGVEFNAVREYRPGDPLSRVDWRRLARTGDLSTVQFSEERAASVVLVVDARAHAYATDAEGVAALEHELRGAGDVAAALLDAGDQVGLAAYGPTWTWLAPGSGRDHRLRLRERLALDDAFPPSDPDVSTADALAFRRLRKNVPRDAQIVLATPLLDGTSAFTARRLESHGYPVTVLSPDVTGRESVGGRLAAVERRGRVRELRSAGVRVVDWDPVTPLAVALARTATRWSR